MYTQKNSKEIWVTAACKARAHANAHEACLNILKTLTVSFEARVCVLMAGRAPSNAQIHKPALIRHLIVFKAGRTALCVQGRAALCAQGWAASCAQGRAASHAQGRAASRAQGRAASRAWVEQPHVLIRIAQLNLNWMEIWCILLDIRHFI